MKQKTNGFSLPLHLYQMGTWLLVIWHLFIPIITQIVSPFSELSFTFPVLFYISSVILVVSGFVVTKSDPGAYKTPLEVEYVNTGDSFSYYCTVCRAYVGKQVRHCGQCNKCIESFDHHCKWLNNCIGSKNYSKFIILLIATILNLSILCAFESFYLTKHEKFLIAILSIDLAINSFSLLTVLYLAGFHIYLYFSGISTYEFIKSRRPATEVVPKKKIDKVSLNSKRKVFASKSLDSGTRRESSEENGNEHAHSVSEDDVGVNISIF